MKDAEFLESCGLRVKVCGDNFLKVWDARKMGWICYYPSSGSFHYDRGSAIGRGLEALVTYLGVKVPRTVGSPGLVSDEYLDHALSLAREENGPLSEVVRTLVDHIRSRR